MIIIYSLQLKWCRLSLVFAPHIGLGSGSALGLGLKLGSGCVQGCRVRIARRAGSDYLNVMAAHAEDELHVGKKFIGTFTLINSMKSSTTYSLHSALRSIADWMSWPISAYTVYIFIWCWLP